MKGLSSLTAAVAQYKDIKIVQSQAQLNVAVNLEASTSENPGAS